MDERCCQCVSIIKSKCPPNRRVVERLREEFNNVFLISNVCVHIYCPNRGTSFGFYDTFLMLKEWVWVNKMTLETHPQYDPSITIKIATVLKSVRLELNGYVLHDYITDNFIYLYFFSRREENRTSHEETIYTIGVTINSKIPDPFYRFLLLFLWTNCSHYCRYLDTKFPSLHLGETQPINLFFVFCFLLSIMNLTTRLSRWGFYGGVYPLSHKTEFKVGRKVPYLEEGHFGWHRLSSQKLFIEFTFNRNKLC